MAAELSLSLTFSFTKTACPTVPQQTITLTPTVTGTQLMDNVQIIGITEEAILLGDVAAGGYCFVQNMDTTNFVEIRSGTGAVDIIKLLAGEIALFRMSGDATAPYAIADTAPCNVRFLRFDL